MKKIILSGSVIILVAVIAIGVTGAFFSDTETSEGNRITTGALDLTINGFNRSVSAVVVIDDMKPSQTWYSGPITLGVFNNPGKLYKHIVRDSIFCETVTVTEPECTDQGGTWDNNQCSLVKDENYLPEIIWFDLEVLNEAGGWDVIIPDGEITVDEIASHWIYLGQYGERLNENEVTIRQSFHMFGEAGNEYQSDSCTFTEEFMVLQTNAPHPDNLYVPSGLILDSIDVGDSDSLSMTSHNAQDWFDDPQIGNYGGRDGGDTLAMIGGDDDDNQTCDSDENDATFVMDAGSETASMLMVRHLDGSANDSFNVYVDDVLVGSYTGGQTTGETWVTTSFALSGQSFSGTATVKLEITGNYPWSSCSTYGQGAINWAQITN